MGCETLQRKFTRKPKPAARPQPIVAFQDYTRAMTTLDRYRKHYLLFDYWNEDLLQALQRGPFNAKRLVHASAEGLAELKILQGLLTDERAHELQPLVEEREAIHQQLSRPMIGGGQASGIRRVLEAQARRLHRDFYWRDVEDHLNTR